MSDHSDPTTCRFCSAPLPPRRSGAGRPRLYCSGQCRARQYMASHFAVNVGAIIDRWGSVCYLCGDEVDPDAPFGPTMLNVDHVVPLSRDGGDYIQNLRVVHYACNLRKGAHLVCPHCVEPI